METEGRDNRMQYVICPSCGAAVPDVKFCVECGSVLEGAARTAAPEKKDTDPGVTAQRTPGQPGQFPAFVFASRTEDAHEPQRSALSDEGLTLLVNICRKTVATVGGDGYSEIVLYRDDDTGEYWLHTYSKYVYMKEEAHASYAAGPELAERVMDYIEEHGLASWKDLRLPSLTGGDYVIRFRHGDGVIRLDSGNMPDGQTAYSEIGRMLYAGATEENRRYAGG